jgi:O-antigen ligase
LLSGKKISIKSLRSEDILVFLLIIFVTLASVVNTREASVNYVAAYTYVFLFAYLGLKLVLYNVVNSDKILDWVLYGAIVTAVGSILEFAIEFGLDFSLNDYLFRFKQADALFGQIFPRSMAFSTEPGILAFFLETLGLISIGVIVSREWSTFYKSLWIGVIIVGWILAFSAASVAALGVGGIVALSVKWFRHRQALKRILPLLIIPMVVIGGIIVMNYARNTPLGDIVAKITLQTDASGSAGMRLQRWTAGLDKILERPLLGEGPGTAASEGRVSNISWYIFLAVEAGLLSLVPVLLFIISKTLRMLNSRIENKYWFLSAYIAGSIHLAVISTFFNPFLWTLIIVFDILDVRTNS